MDPSLDARGSERSLEVALADPAEGSHNITDDLDDSALVERRRHGRGEAARARFDWLLAVPVRALPLYAESGDTYEPRVELAMWRVPRIARASPACPARALATATKPEPPLRVLA